MKININNFIAIGQADIQLAPKITMISGENGSGKTSIMTAMYCLLSGETSPDGVMKKNSSELIKRGFGSASISVADDSGEYEISYPKMTTTDTGFKFISKHSADIRHNNIVDMTPATRAKEMISILGAEPTKEELRTALSFVGDKQFSDIYSNLMLGWDTVAENMTEKAKQSKTLWSKVTGENYGSAKSANWIPSNWSSDIDGKDLQELETEVTTAATLVESAISMNAVSESEYSEMQKLALNMEFHKTHFETLNIQHKSYTENLEDIASHLAVADAEYKKLFDGMKQYSCPCCGELVELVSGELVKAGTITTDADKKTLADRIKQLREDQKTARNYLFEGTYNRAVEDLKACEKAIEYLKNNKPQTDNSLQIARENHKRAVENLEAYKKRTEAKLHADNVSHYLNIADVLKSTGLRAEKLKGKHKEFSKMLSEMFPDWNITCDSDFTPLVNGFYRMSDAQNWMAKVAYMVVVAKLRGDRIVIIDEIEALDRDTKITAIKYLYKSGLQVVMANACTGDKDSIDISKIPNCKKYRISEGGVVIDGATDMAMWS